MSESTILSLIAIVISSIVILYESIGIYRILKRHKQFMQESKAGEETT